MKYLLSILLIVVVTSLCVSCKKSTNVQKPPDKQIDTANKPHLYITLYDKPLDTIQKYITGNWKLVYTSGGFTGGKMYYDSTYWQLSAKRIKQIYPANKGGVLIDTTINWILAPIAGIDSSFVIQCFDDRSYPYDYFALRIYNDTLIIREDAADAFHYHFIKNN